jgi:sodium-coupled neutral amino acid transporter 11
VIPLEYELDSDDIDDETAAQSSLEHGTHRGREQSMPLLVGLLDASAIRRSLDIPMGMDGVSECADVDLDELATKQSSGGGILNSIANMANSILGAGACFAYFSYPSLKCPSPLKESSVRQPSAVRHPFLALSISSGLPYAMSRSGFYTGLFLLVVLCYVTDWTIRLIVTNAKLSGTNSYIGIMNRCFGPSGRAAISFFQFSFAFGGTYILTITGTFFSLVIGMCAFGIIIGE